MKKYPTLMQTVAEVRDYSDADLARLLLVTQDRMKEHGRERARIRREMLDLKRQESENDGADYAQAMLQAVITAELDARRRYQPQPESSPQPDTSEFWERITDPEGFWEERG